VRVTFSEEEAMAFAQSAFAQFFASSAGRVLRVVAGLALIGSGYTLRGQTSGLVLMVVGLVPLLAGAFDVCLLSPLFGGPMSGRAIRASGKSGV
jgi:hypothetical protein